MKRRMTLVLIAVFAFACGGPTEPPVENLPREITGTWEGLHSVDDRVVWAPEIFLRHDDETTISGNWALKFEGDERWRAYGAVEGTFRDPQVEFTSTKLRIEEHYDVVFDFWCSYTGQAVEGEDDPTVIRGEITYYYDYILPEESGKRQYTHTMDLYRVGG